MSLNPAKFPFYRLPLLALQEVITSMDLDVMFFFSLASTKSKTVLKISLPKHCLHLDCSLWGEKRITLESPSCNNKFALRLIDSVLDDQGSFQLQTVQFRYFAVFNNAFDFCGNGPLEVQVRELTSYLAEILHLPKISMDFQSVIEPQTALELLHYVKNLSLPMVRIELGTQNTPAEIYKAFLDEGSQIRDSLIMGCRAPVGFQYTPSEDFHLERFEVRDGGWVNLEDYINCRHVIVHNATRSRNMCCLTAQRLNQFFKNWQRSGCRLERLQVDVFSVFFTGGINFDEVIVGLNGINITRDQFDDSVDIVGQDGKKATIRWTPTYLTLEIKT